MLPSLMKVFSEFIWIISLWVSFTALYVIEPQVSPATDVSPEPQPVSSQKEDLFKEIITLVSNQFGAIKALKFCLCS